MITPAPTASAGFRDYDYAYQHFGDLLPSGTAVYDLSMPLVENHPAFGMKTLADEVVDATLAVQLGHDAARTFIMRLATAEPRRLVAEPVHGAMPEERGDSIFKAFELILRNDQSPQLRGLGLDGQCVVLPPANGETPGAPFSGHYYFYEHLSLILRQRIMHYRQGEHYSPAGYLSTIDIVPY